MRIDYPDIEWEDVQKGDTVLSEVKDVHGTRYYEFAVSDLDTFSNAEHRRFYLINRPAKKFPYKMGSLILATKVRNVLLDKPTPMILLQTNGTVWRFLDTPGSFSYSEITEWVAAKVVPE